MIRTLFFLVIVAISLIIILPIGLVLRLIQGRDKFAPIPKAANFIMEKAIPLFAKLGGCEYEIKGQENIPKGPVLFAGNHQGNFDVLLILFAFNRAPIIIAKKEAKYVPIAHLWMNMIHVIFMNRKDLRQSLKCIKDSQSYLENGYSVCIFPEGTRSHGPDMGEFKHGAFKAALKAKVPVVPFVIDGTYKVYERQHYLKKEKVTLNILRPVYLTGEEKTQDISDTVQKNIQDELDRIRYLDKKHE